MRNWHKIEKIRFEISESPLSNRVIRFYSFTSKNCLKIDHFCTIYIFETRNNSVFVMCHWFHVIFNLTENVDPISPIFTFLQKFWKISNFKKSEKTFRPVLFQISRGSPGFVENNNIYAGEHRGFPGGKFSTGDSPGGKISTGENPGGNYYSPGWKPPGHLAGMFL